MTGVLVQCTFANTPVVSPDNKKNPGWRGLEFFQIVALHRCHRGAALPSMNDYLIFWPVFNIIPNK